MKFKYKVVTIVLEDFKSQEGVNILNKYGELGWRVVSTVLHNDLVEVLFSKEK